MTKLRKVQRPLSRHLLPQVLAPPTTLPEPCPSFPIYLPPAQRYRILETLGCHVIHCKSNPTTASGPVTSVASQAPLPSWDCSV